MWTALRTLASEEQTFVTGVSEETDSGSVSVCCKRDTVLDSHVPRLYRVLFETSV